MAIILENEPLWDKTTFKIGGPAARLIFPETVKELAELIKPGEASFILGGGSNLLVSDEGVSVNVVSLERCFTGVSIERRPDGEVIVNAQAGISLTKLSGIMKKESAAGLEFAYGIPGTLGGALKMNAGAYCGEMKDVIESVSLITADGEARTLTGDECGFKYRASTFPEGSVLTGAVLKLEAGETEKINEKMKTNQAKRKEKQPLDMPSAGSVYKNPANDYAGRLIEECGLKGAREGGAMVSEKHANFIVNMGVAKSGDVFRLMKRIEKSVNEIFGVKLEREIKLIGEFDE